jgi:hypothetical protein
MIVLPPGTMMVGSGGTLAEVLARQLPDSIGTKGRVCVFALG